MNFPNLTILHAVLIIDSRDSRIGARSQAFSGGWSRLYQVGDYYLDLSFKPDPKKDLLLGRLLPSSPTERLIGNAKLSPIAGGLPSETLLESSGEFRLICPQRGTYELLVDLSEKSLYVQHLEIN